MDGADVGCVMAQKTMQVGLGPFELDVFVRYLFFHGPAQPIHHNAVIKVAFVPWLSRFSAPFYCAATIQHLHHLLLLRGGGDSRAGLA